MVISHLLFGSWVLDDISGIGFFLILKLWSCKKYIYFNQYIRLGSIFCWNYGIIPLAFHIQLYSDCYYSNVILSIALSSFFFS